VNTKVLKSLSKRTMRGKLLNMRELVEGWEMAPEVPAGRRTIGDSRTSGTRGRRPGRSRRMIQRLRYFCCSDSM